MIKWLRDGILGFLHELGSLGIFMLQVARTWLSTEGNFKPVMEQIAYVTIRTLPTVAFAGVFVGAILVLQFNEILVQYDAQSFLGGLNTSSVVREVGPLIISFLLAGKIGAYTAAELGTMRVTEQIDAIQCLGTNPIQYLIVPRFVGIVISSLILLVIGLLISIVGSMFVAWALCGINTLQYAMSVTRFTDGWTLFGGMSKSLVYGIIVAGVACHRGYTASGGARGVGKAVTLAAVYTNLYIVIANYVVGHLIDAVSEMGRMWLGGVT